MISFKYKALDRKGNDVSGIIEANNEKQAITKLKSQGIRPLEIKEYNPSSLSLNIFNRTKVKKSEIVSFTRQLATLLNAGLPLLRCLNILSQQSKNSVFKKIISDVAHDVQGGLSFSESLAKHKIFDKLYVNMIKAGEAGGVLDVITDRLALFGEKDLELKTKIKGAMTYPVVMLVVALGVVSFLLIAVLPTFVTMFQEMNVMLPAPTLFVINLSNFLTNFWYIIIILFVLLFFALKQYRKSNTGRYNTDLIKLKIPVFGNLNLKAITAQFTRTLGTLLESGVSILQALKIVRNTVTNEVVARVIDDISESIGAGKSMSAPIDEKKVFDTMVAHMIAVGEETGSIDKMLIKIADQYDVIVDELVSALSSMLEPFLIIFMGGAVGLIVLALFLPMFELVSIVG